MRAVRTKGSGVESNRCGVLAEIDRRRSSVSIQRSSAGAGVEFSVREVTREKRRERAARIALEPMTVLLDGREEKRWLRSSEPCSGESWFRPECHSCYAGRCWRVQPAFLHGLRVGGRERIPTQKGKHRSRRVLEQQHSKSFKT